MKIYFCNSITNECYHVETFTDRPVMSAVGNNLVLYGNATQAWVKERDNRINNILQRLRVENNWEDAGNIGTYATTEQNAIVLIAVVKKIDEVTVE